MNKVLGIDYGRKKIGLAIAEGKLAEPYRVIRYKLPKEAIEKVVQVVKVEQVDKIIVGVSEGRIAEETGEFGRRLEDKLGIPVVFQDETLTTQRAQELSIAAGVKRKKRRHFEDAYSASLILQDYLDFKDK